MTNINFEIDEENISLIVKGHALYNPGEDIVCAAISQLVTTYASLIEDNREKMKLEELYLDAGDVRVKFGEIEEKELKTEVENYSAFLVRGFKLLEEAFPDNVNFQFSLENQKLN